MRRTTANVSPVAAEQRRLIEQIEALADMTRGSSIEGSTSFDAGSIAAELDAFITDARRARLKSVFASRLDCVTVVMDAPHDPHNGAAVLRSCDAFGVQRLHVVERLEPFLSANTVSRGSERWVEARTYDTARAAIEALAESGHELVATHPEGDLTPDDLCTIPRLALVLGNERDGIHDELTRACNRTVRIPMRGFAESLNVSVTAAILLEHATRGREGDLSERERLLLYARALVLTVPRAAEILAARRVC